MYQVMSIENRVIDPDIATKMLSMNTYAHQRGIRSSHVKELADKMADGRYTGGHIAFGVNGKATYLVDGQHTLNAVVQSGSTIDAIVKRVKCTTDEDLAELWQQYDGGIPRSLQDYVRSEAGALGIEWTPRITSLIAGAAAVATYGLSSRGITKSEKTKLLKLFLKEGDFVDRIIGGDSSTTRFMQRQQVVAVMMLSFRADQEAANRFWVKVKTGEMITKMHPAYHLRNFLMTNTTKGIIFSRQCTPREFYVRTAKAWNFYRKNKAVKMLKYSITEQIPTIL